MEVSELKRRLRQAGFEVYRTQDGHVTLAERVRDNLILDSGIAVSAADPLSVRLAIRAHASHFPGKTADEVREAAHRLATVFESEGFAREDEGVSPVAHPSEPERTIDTTFEVLLRRAVRPEELEALVRRCFAARRSSVED